MHIIIWLIKINITEGILRKNRCKKVKIKKKHLYNSLINFQKQQK